MGNGNLCGLVGRWTLAFCLGGAGLTLANSARADEPAEIVLTPEPAPVAPPNTPPALDFNHSSPRIDWQVVRAQALEEPAPAPKPLPKEIKKPALALQYNGPVLAIDLPTALRLVNASNPTIALARARVDEAYARLRETRTLWLPTLETGPSYYRHDGNIQNAHGDVFRDSKSNFFEGGGAALRVHSGDALFAPLIARRLARAEDAAALATTEEVQLDVAVTYLDLLRAYGALAVNADSLARAQELARSAAAAIKQGKSKSGADLNHAQAEVELRLEERIGLEGQAAVTSARLAQLLLLDPTVNLRPLDPAVLPITLIPESQVPLDELVATGLMNRPELAASRELVAASLARWRQARLSPLLPRLEVSYYGGTFGGGINGTLANYSSRGDGTAQIVWELPGLGAGYAARTQVQRALYNQANFHVNEIQAQIGAEVTSAAKVAQTWRRALEHAQLSINEMLKVWGLLRKAAFGMAQAHGRFDPTEGLFAEQQLNQTRLQYLNQVIEYNKAQFRLYRALGQPPLEALPRAVSIPVQVEAAPGGLGNAETIRLPRVQGDKK